VVPIQVFSLQKIPSFLSSLPIILMFPPFFASRLLLRLTLTSVARELYPYGMKLNSIDGMRIGGKFMTEDGSIPEGQGTVHALLAECYELLHELRSEIEEDD
jgi:hypothetical protein